MNRKILAISAVSCLVAGAMVVLPTFAAINHMARHKPVGSRTLTGTVKSLSSASFILVAKKRNYTVNVGAGTKVTNRLHRKIKFSEINVNDKVQVVGTSTELTIHAQIVRDLTLPRHASSTGRMFDSPDPVDSLDGR